MALARWTGLVQDANGNALPGAQIEVRRESDGGLQAIFSDREGVVGLANPFVAPDATVFFHAVGGSYRVKASLGGFERTWRYVAMGMAAELDDDALQGGLIPEGSLSGSKLEDETVDIGKLAGIASARVLGRLTTGDGPVELLTGDQVLALLGFSAFFEGLRAVANGPALFTAMGASQSLGTNGYLTLPGGLLLQFGTVAGGSSTATVTFPVAFPTACRSVQATINNSATSQVFSVQTYSFTATQFTYRKNQIQTGGSGGGGAAAEAFTWFAIGH